MKDVIIALDFDSREKTLDFLDKFTDEKLFVKVGMELFYKEGPSIIKDIKDRGHKIFLDLKLHDIPNTVKNATISLKNLGVDMINFHAKGGYEMLKAASENCENMLSLAVTILTSTDEKSMHDEILIDKDIDLDTAVLKYAKMAKSAGINGVVCSSLEVPKIKSEISDIITVTPGIRPKNSGNDDQKRVVTPKMARELGSDYIVVGRPITKSENPKKAYIEIRDEFLGGN